MIPISEGKYERLIEDSSRLKMIKRYVESIPDTYIDTSVLYPFLDITTNEERDKNETFDRDTK